MTSTEQRPAAPTHYTLTVTAEQLHLISQATEACARFLMGQTSDIAFSFLGGLPIDEFCHLRDELDKLGPLVTGERPHYYKARTEEIEHVKEGLFLIYQAVRQPLYLDRMAAEGKDPGMSVAQYDPLPTAGWQIPVIYSGPVEGTPWSKP